MTEYRLVFARAARKDLQALDESLAARVLKQIEVLPREPRPAGCRKIQGTTQLFRIRVGDYRVVYAVDDGQELIDVLAVRHRRDAYR